MATLKGIAFAFAALFVVFSVIEWRSRRWRGRRLFRAGYLTDVTWWFLTPMLHWLVQTAAILLIVVPLALVVWGRVDQTLVAQGFGPMARLPIWLQSAIILIIGDFVGYWMHRAFHRRRLWRFHAVHHSSTELDWLSSVRVHPINELVMRLAGTAALLPLGLAPIAFASIAPVLTLFAILLHADLDWDWGPLRRVIASPRFHRWHHTDETAARDKNFAGLFPVWDILFGTFYMPRDARPTRFGTSTPVGNTIMQQIIGPFRRRTAGAR